ncbi:MAG: PilZ domain-containing protein [Bacteriovoracaceae bacterium]|nr:PilZ domain-containing protein [Bacteriovoracaceae bacterium]
MADKVLDFVQKKKESTEKKRRSFERVLFTNLLGTYSAVHDNGNIYPITMVDMSYDGCLFQIPWEVRNGKEFEIGSETTLRMYFTKSSYIPAVITIKYCKEVVEKDGVTYAQYGCEFDKSMHSFDALSSFIDFLYKFAELSTIDHGDSKVFFL